MWSSWKNLLGVHVALQTGPYKAFLDFWVGKPIKKNIHMSLS